MARLSITLLSIALVLANQFAISGATKLQHFRGNRVVDNLDVAGIENKLTELLDASHARGSSPVKQRLAKIEAGVARTYQSLPKNDLGRLTPRSVRYIVHNYFAKEHGWQIKGLEPENMCANVSEVHQASILQDKAPALVEAILESHESDRGLTLQDVATMVALLERLVLDESINLLEGSYFLNEESSRDLVDTETLHDILRSYLIVFQMGLRVNLTDVKKHQAIKRKLEARGGAWPTLVEFETDAAMNYRYQIQHVTNPFVPELFPFEATSHIIDGVAQDYGKWQNSECSRMKAALMDMDAEGHGLIPLSQFYTKSTTREYQFTESVEYLREIGAIEEADRREPHVRIANYVTGPSNCIASSNYYSVCCLNECDSLMNELEGSIKAPTSSVEHIMSLVQNLTSSSAMEPPELNADFISKLEAIAYRNDGVVPLHGRLFAQWLHFVYPNECPFPHVTEEANILTAHHWLGGKAVASKEKRADHVESMKVTEQETQTEAEFVESISKQWSEEEVLPLVTQPRTSAGAYGYVRVMVQLAMFLVVLRIALSGWSAATRASFGVFDKKRMLPI